MKPKSILLMSLIIVLNLYGFEPMNPSVATKKVIENFEQIEDEFFTGDDHSFNNYGTKILPSFNCSDAKGKYKFKEYSLEDFVCQSKFLAFRDNYFADLYNLIIKENPNLKEKAQKIARERIAKTQKECIDGYSKYFQVRVKYNYSVGNSIHCTRSYYRNSTAKLALMLYEDDKDLFKRIYGEDYEKFKEVFEDTLKYVPILYSFRDLKDVKETDKNPYAEFLRKYDDYTGNYGNYKIHDLIYIVLVQYSLIDENGHLVLPENRKEE